MRPRIGCLLLPNLPLAAELRAHPELADHPFIVAGGEGPRAEVVSVSRTAVQHGVRRGLTVAHARTLCGDLAVRPASPALEHATREALLDVALSFSPRAALATRASGALANEACVHLDASGIGSLFQSEGGFAAALCAQATRLGLPANVAIAGSRSTALLAARRLSPAGEETHVLRPEEEAACLAPLPIDLLDPDDAVAQTLTRFGVHTVRDLLALPRRGLATRVGPRVLEWIGELCGERAEEPLPEPRDTRLVEAIDLDFPVDRLQSLVFVLQGLLSRLIDRLETRHLACADLELTLELAGGARDTRRIGVAAPTHDLRVLVRLVSHALDARTPRAPVEALRIETEGRVLRRDQLDLFRPAGPAPAVLDETLAALESLCGPKRVGAPQVADDHHPDAFGIRPFERKDTAERCTARSAFTSPLALRALRPPVTARVRLHGVQPDRIESAVIQGRVVRLAGPWRTTGGWWSAEGRFAFDSWDVQTSDGCVARLRFDHVRRLWQIDALYD